MTYVNLGRLEGISKGISMISPPPGQRASPPVRASRARTWYQEVPSQSQAGGDVWGCSAAMACWQHQVAGGCAHPMTHFFERAEDCSFFALGASKLANSSESVQLFEEFNFLFWSGVVLASLENADLGSLWNARSVLAV